MTITLVHAAVTGPTPGGHYDAAARFAEAGVSESECFSTFQFFLADRLPTWVTEENPKFVEFLRLFYKWLNCENDFGRLDILQDLDLTEDSFIKLIKNTYAGDFPDRIVISRENWAENSGIGDQVPLDPVVLVDFLDPDNSTLDVRNFLHFVKDFYQLKSLQEVYEFFFRSFFAKDVEIGYPKIRVMRLSDAPYRGASAGTTGAPCTYWGQTGPDGSPTGPCWYWAEGIGEIPFSARLHGVTCYSPGSTYAMSGDYPACPEGCAPGSPCGVYYWDELGTLSGRSVIQDSKIFQDYSYLINSEVPWDSYWPYVKNIIHPAGLFAAGNFTIWDEFEMPGYTGDVYPVETPIIAFYGAYRFSDTVNFRNNASAVDLYPCGWNPYMSGVTGESTHLEDSGGIWIKDPAGTTAHAPLTPAGISAPLGLTSSDGSITGGTAALNMGVDYFRIFHHPNSWTQQVPSGMTFGGVHLGDFVFLTAIDSSAGSPNDPTEDNSCGY